MTRTGTVTGPQRLGIAQSVGRPGSALDNAVIAGLRRSAVFFGNWQLSRPRLPSCSRQVA
jgi:hypothetical protein